MRRQGNYLAIGQFFWPITDAKNLFISVGMGEFACCRNFDTRVSDDAFAFSTHRDLLRFRHRANVHKGSFVPVPPYTTAMF